MEPDHGTVGSAARGWWQVDGGTVCAVSAVRKITQAEVTEEFEVGSGREVNERVQL